MVHRLICFFAIARGIIIFYVIHFFMLCLLRPIFVRSLLRRFHSNQVPDEPLAMDSQTNPSYGIPPEEQRGEENVKGEMEQDIYGEHTPS